MWRVMTDTAAHFIICVYKYLSLGLLDEPLFNIKTTVIVNICLTKWLMDKLDCLTHCVCILCAPT